MPVPMLNHHQYLTDTGSDFAFSNEFINQKKQKIEKKKIENIKNLFKKLTNLFKKLKKKKKN